MQRAPRTLHRWVVREGAGPRGYADADGAANDLFRSMVADLQKRGTLLSYGSEGEEGSFTAQDVMDAYFEALREAASPKGEPAQSMPGTASDQKPPAGVQVSREDMKWIIVCVESHRDSLTPKDQAQKAYAPLLARLTQALKDAEQ